MKKIMQYLLIVTLLAVSNIVASEQAIATECRTFWLLIANKTSCKLRLHQAGRGGSMQFLEDLAPEKSYCRGIDVPCAVGTPLRGNFVFQLQFDNAFNAVSTVGLALEIPEFQQTGIIMVVLMDEKVTDPSRMYQVPQYKIFNAAACAEALALSKTAASPLMKPILLSKLGFVEGEIEECAGAATSRDLITTFAVIMSRCMYDEETGAWFFASLPRVEYERMVTPRLPASPVADDVAATPDDAEMVAAAPHCEEEINQDDGGWVRVEEDGSDWLEEE